MPKHKLKAQISMRTLKKPTSEEQVEWKNSRNPKTRNEPDESKCVSSRPAEHSPILPHPRRTPEGMHFRIW